MTDSPDLRARLVARILTDEELRKNAHGQVPMKEEQAARFIEWYAAKLPRNWSRAYDYVRGCRFKWTLGAIARIFKIIRNEPVQMRREALAPEGFADCVANLPGLGRPLGYPHGEANDHFPTLGLEHGLSRWTAVTLLNREVCMLSVVENLTNKPEWWIKCRDPGIAQRWKDEMLAMDWPAITGLPYGDLSPKAADAVIEELRAKATLYEETGLIPVMDYSAAAIKSDKILCNDLVQALKTAMVPLEDVPAEQKDWHPGSGNQVLDLVHPSLWPLVYGKTRILMEKCIGVNEALDHCGTGLVLPKPRRVESDSNPISRRFQWLPCDVTISPEGKTKVDSYINNLHPKHHAALYPIIEKFIEKSLPAWDVVYRWPKSFETQRLAQSDCGRVCHFPEICKKHQVCSPTNHPVEPAAPRGDDDEDEEEDEYYDEETREEKDLDWYRETHVPSIPDPSPGYFQFNSGDVRSSGFFDSASRIQVIVKLANIHLTPDSPAYEGGSWHVEGMLNEHICATALFYYDSENITDSHLNFRAPGNREGLDEGELDYENDDRDAIHRVYAMAHFDAHFDTVQNVGGVLTREGRALFFPNVYQHRVGPFKLQDPTKPGHRKILALFLVDPKIPIISTANVPPQQKHWWSEATNLSASVLGSDPPNLISRLPMELREMIAGHVTHLADWEDAKKTREELMKERSAGTDILNSGLGETLSFCEH